MRRVLTVAGGVVALWVATAVFALPASAHPLGNFSVNVYNGIVISPSEVRINHVVDLAELPTVQAMPQLDANGDDAISSEELGSFARQRCESAVGDLEFRLADTPSDLSVDSSTATLADGQAGLSTARIECSVRGPVALNGSEGVSFTDNSITDEVGWHEITLRGDGAAVTDADVPVESQSAALTAYPESQQSSPLRVTTASATVAIEEGAGEGTGLGGGATAADENLSTTTVTGDSKPWDWGADLLGRATSAATGPAGMSVAIVVALMVGAVHALAPGHGKSLVAFALAGRQERAARAAVTVGTTVTVTHTASVLALGMVIAGTATVVPRELYSALGALTGVVVIVLGVVLLRNALRDSGMAHSHSHGHSHDHAHDHLHDPDGTQRVAGVPSIALMQHTHEPAVAAPELPRARRGMLVALGITGGLLPSPSAVVVLLASAASGRPWFGVILVLAFGVGMACTLAGVGFAVLRGQDRLLALAERSPRPWLSHALRHLPVVTAATVTVIGTLLLVTAVF